MTGEEAAWVRDNVWTQTMRKTHSHVPRYAFTCACQNVTAAWCETQGHSRTHDATGLPSWEACITRKDETVVAFAVPYQHPTLSATGAHLTRYAQVWLADRLCRRMCSCSCHAEPSPAAEQLDLFAAVA